MKESLHLARKSCLLMGLFLVLGVGLLPGIKARAAQALNTPLDASDPVYFYGDTIEYQGETIALGEKSIYIDGTLTDAQCSRYQYVYNDFKKAYEAGAFQNGLSLTDPMNVYIAPYVYWIDDPDDETVREGVNGDKVPYGLWMNCNYLSLNGLSKDPDNVVLAVNRGQSHGAVGNFTMFYINGTGTHTENLTMGNYCCMDLVYPLKPELGREKRTSTITQSQLCLTNGSRITAENCNFVSRLNSCPFVGGSRILFQDCHFECTDDSLPTGAVYVNCDFDFYSSKPFYNTTGTGSVMLGCDFNIMHNSSQYLTKVDGVVDIIDSTFYLKNKDQYVGWTPNPSAWLRCVSGNVKTVYEYEEDGGTKKEIVENYTMDADAPYDNVNITGTDAMNAYVAEINGEKVYNVYNLLKGSDDWDPLNQKDALLAAEGQDTGKYTDVPVALTCNMTSAAITDGQSRTVSSYVKAFTGTTAKTEAVTWSVEDSLKDYITLTTNSDGSCTLTCKNDTLNIVKGMVYATGKSGLMGGCYVSAAPKTQPAPTYVNSPSLKFNGEGQITAEYLLSNADILEDISNISWYRCNDAKGEISVLTATTNTETPLKNYTLGYGDVGYYIKAVITAKEQCTNPAEPVTVITGRTVTLADVKASPYVMDLDFTEFACPAQIISAPGFWIRDTYTGWQAQPIQKNVTSWTYGEGDAAYGAAGISGLLPTQRGARLLYQPASGTYGDMSVTFTLDTEKTAGQGFGSAGQYLDIYIKYDAAAMTGYGFRLERVKETSNGVQAALVKFDKGAVTYISDKVLTSAFNSEVTINVAVTGNTLSAAMTTTHAQSEKQQNENLAHRVDLQAEIEANGFGGLGVLDTSTVAIGNRILFRHLTVNWAEDGTKLDTPSAADLRTEEQKAADNQPDSPAPGTNQPGTNQPGTGNNAVTTPPSTAPGKKSAPKKGTVVTVSGVKFKITNASANGKGTVAVSGLKKKNKKSVVIPAKITYKGIQYKVTSIQGKAFSGCKKLKKITVKSKTITKVGKNAFKNIHKKCVIKVPSSKLKKYKKLMKKKGQAKTVKIKK